MSCTADEAFLADRLPQLVSDLLARLGSDSAGHPPNGSTTEPPPTVVGIAGEVLDYWTSVPLVRASVQLGPNIGAGSDEAGRFVLSGQWEVSEGTVTVIPTSPGYWVTNTLLQISTQAISHTVYAVSRADIQRQYATLNLFEDPNRNNVVIVDLLNSLGDPMEMIPASDLVLTRPNGSPSGVGPFFFGPAGDLSTSSDLPVSRAFGGRARAAFLNVEYGTHFVQSFAGPAGEVAFKYVEVMPTVTIGEVIFGVS